MEKLGKERGRGRDGGIVRDGSCGEAHMAPNSRYMGMDERKYGGTGKDGGGGRDGCMVRDGGTGKDRGTRADEGTG